MTPKEKAEELFRKFWLSSLKMTRTQAIKQAIICVDEIISACEYNGVESYNSIWWLEVKTELEKL